MQAPSRVPFLAFAAFAFLVTAAGGAPGSASPGSASAIPASSAASTAAATAAIDSLLEAERYDDAIRAARAEIARLESTASPGAPASRDPAAILALRSALMLAHFHSGDLAAARVQQDSVVALRAALVPDDDAQLADDFNDLAMICDRLGDDAAAATAWRRSLAILHRGKMEEFAARVVPRTSALAEAERRLGRFAECERLLRHALALSEKYLPRDHRHARIVNNLGALAWDERRYDEATSLLGEALRITEEDPKSTPLRRAVAQSNLANLKREQGETQEAGRLHEKAVAIAREHLTQDPQYPIFLKELAVARADAGRFEEAFALTDEALAALGNRPDELLASDILYERARAKMEVGDLPAAETALAKCLAIRRAKRRADHPTIGQTLAAIGTLQVRRGRTREARVRFAEATAILEKSAVHPEERVEALAGLARLDWSAGRRADAITTMQQALDALEALRIHRTASELARADWAGRAADDASTLIEWLVRERRLDEALATGERLRGRILADQLAAAHVDWRADLAPALRATLATREREALALIRGARRDLEAELAGAQEGGAKAAAIEARLEEATRMLRETFEEGRAGSRSWARALRTERDAGDVARETRARLAEGEIALVYHLGRESGFVFEIAPGSPVRCNELRVSKETARAWGVREGAFTETIASAAVFAGRGPSPRSPENPVAQEGGARAATRGVGAARPATKGTGSEADSARAASPARSASAERFDDLRRLGDILLPAPTRARVLAASRVHVLPDGPLHDLPFEALVLEGNDFWLDRGPVVDYGNSLQHIAFSGASDPPRGAPPDPPRGVGLDPSRSVSSPWTVLSVIDPDRGTNGERSGVRAPSEMASEAWSRRFPPLPGSRREADALVRAFASAKIVRLEGKNAREAAVKKAAPEARVLHFGTHGLVEGDANELLAALVLAEEPKGSSEDGFLHLFEVYEMQLRCELVVLSACDTKLGRNIRGEGVLALSRGFLAAGAERVVAALWPVDDDATSRLMSAFFEGVGQGGDAAVALRDAKRAVRGRPETADPFFWAGFVANGSF